MLFSETSSKKRSKNIATTRKTACKQASNLETSENNVERHYKDYVESRASETLQLKSSSRRYFRDKIVDDFKTRSLTKQVALSRAKASPIVRETKADQNARSAAPVETPTIDQTFTRFPSKSCESKPPTSPSVKGSYDPTPS